ncbi:Os06g0660400, partial [Oryza sativa Japonica Group]
ASYYHLSLLLLLLLLHAAVTAAAEMMCGKEEKLLGVQKAPGSCPYCGGGVAATDVEAKWVLCFLPLCLNNKRRFSCTACNRRLVSYPAIVHD